MIFKPYYCDDCKQTMFLVEKSFDDEIPHICPYCGREDPDSIVFFNPEIFRFGPSDKIEDVEGVTIEYK